MASLASPKTGSATCIAATILLMLRKHLVIVGSGWAGLKLLRELKSVPSSDLRITLVSDNSSFRYSAALYRVATGRREREAIIPLSEILEDLPNVTFEKATITSIDRKAKTLKTSAGKIIHYDIAVLALGVVTTYFGIPGLEQWSYSIKTSRELRLLRTHLHQELMDEQAPDKNYVVIGAGPTGVELAAALTSYMKSVAKKHGLKRRRITVSLVEAAPRVLPSSAARVSKITQNKLRRLGIKVLLNKKVERETNHELIVSGKAIPTHTVIWTAGVNNSPFYRANSSEFNLSARGKVIVDDHLRVDNSVYVIGDNADTPYSGLGLTAVHNAHYVGKDIKQRLKGGKKTLPYKPLTPAIVLPVGSRWGVFQYRKLILWGLPAAILRSLADLIAYHDIIGPYKAFGIWIRSDSREEICTICQVALEKEHHMQLLMPHGR